MKKPQPPRLFKGRLSGRIYVTTRYKDLGEGRFQAITKHDVTEDFETLLAELVVR